MKLSEAIREGIKLRPRVGALGERFSHVEGRGLCSDIWGAAVEAEKPYVADLNWNPLNVFAFHRSMDVFRALQLDIFGAYFTMPARCPGARRMFSEMGGRMIRRFGKEPELKTYERGVKIFPVRGITSECDKVEHLAGLVDHMYHKHRMSAEEIIQFVQSYEDAREYGIKPQVAINQNFNHHQLNGG